MTMPMPIAAGKSIVYDLWPDSAAAAAAASIAASGLVLLCSCSSQISLSLSVHVCVSVCCTCVYVVSSLCLFMWNAIITIICLIYDSIL